MPPDVADVLQRRRSATCSRRAHGSLLWLGALVGLWTTGSFIETIRDIIRRAYGVTFSRPFWEYRLGSIGMIIAAVVMAMIAFSVSILLSGVQQFLVDQIPGADDLVGLLTLLRVAPALVLFGSLYLLFYGLTPKRYRMRLPQMAGRGLRRDLVGGDDRPAPRRTVAAWAATTSPMAASPG